MAETSELSKRLGLVHVFCIASGAMISSGLFVLPGLAHARAGPAVILSYLIAGLFASAGMLSIAELATAMPKAGGDYFFVTRGMGPGVGTAAGLLTWFSLSLKSAFALVGMAAFTQLLVGLNIHVIAVAFCILFVLVNLYGVKEAATFQVLLVGGLLVLMVLYVAFGVHAIEVTNFKPFVSKGYAAIFSTAGFVFVSFGGLLKVASVSEEVRQPGRTIPLGLILSLLVVTAFYTLMVFVTSGVLPASELDGSLTPISDGAEAAMGGWGRTAMSVGAVLAFVSTANAGIMAASRYLLALSRDRLLPDWFARVSPRRGTPTVAVLTTGGFMIVALFLKLDILVEAASTVLILSYMLANLAVVVLRESRVQNYRPRFRAPFYPWVQLVGLVGCAFVLLEMGKEAFAIAATLVAVGFFTYWFYGRKRAIREHALLHLIERLTARDLVTGTLERELKDIIRERDAIVRDRFDRLIEEAPVLDLEAATSRDAFFRAAAETLAPSLGTDEATLRQRLEEREAEGSTAIAPWLAVPHVVVEGEGRFAILLARCREGIAFSEGAPAVQTVFVLAGTADERNFHLRALTAIAQMVDAEDFKARWLAARGEAGLRDVLLLGERQRLGEA